MLAGTADTIAPAYLEQIPLFERLPMADRQLAIWQGGTHFSSIAVPPGEEPSIALPSILVGPDPQIAHRDLEAISLAFIRAHLMDNPDAHSLLAPSALAALGNATLPIVAIDSASLDRDQTGHETGGE
jgi:predicted dienelactone hydrolase